ncbi:Gamma-soluble NSF attachment protein [Phytophthora cinnamomi]|uniref:Gamma-soluble NSF attachment protein n=1 Tax=Phytophthora cinnamomi TaxID=4785 RepID=UPI00355A9418|nr:Gamma-soluble NSF attachment protein [Phytophthora cinnamomi]
MSSLQQHKCAEAAAELKQAEKALAKRSFFRGAPDYLSAAPHLDKAGELFRLGGDFEASKQAFTRCADAQLHNQSPFRAAQAWENVAKTALQQLKAERAGAHSAQQRTAEARKAYETASGCYVDMGELGKAADALVKGAQACETHGCGADDVLPLYWKACELLEAQDKPHLAVETFRKTLSFLVKSGKLGEAVKLLDRITALYEAMDQRHNVHKAHLSQVILMLASGDVPAADALYSRCLQDDSFLSSDDCALAEDLVRAFKMGNEELLQATVRKPGFMALDNQVGRICRKLSVYGSGDAAPPRPQQHHRPAPSSAGGVGQQQPNQRNPFAPSARAAPAQRNPFAPSSRAPAAAPPPAPVHAPSLDSEYDVGSSEAPTASGSDVRDSDYEAMLAAALGEVGVSNEDKEPSAPAPAPRAREEIAPKAQQPASPERSDQSSPNLAPSPPPAAVRASVRMDYEIDDLEFAMPDSDSLEFSIPDDPATAFEPSATPAPKPEAPAPASKPAPKAAAPMYDEFDLT